MQAEFATLLERHASLLYKVANAYCREFSDREDLVAEIAAALWRSFPRYDRSRRFTTWAYRIALNVAISFQRRQRRHDANRAATAVRWENIPASPPVCDDLERLHGLIAALGDLERALILLFLDGYDHAAIAETLGISATNVATKLHRIKARLRRDAADDRAKENAS